MLEVDGSLGEGGGQVVRSSLSLSLATGRPVRIDRIRAGRDRSGLRPQHLAAVRAAAEVGRADVEGAESGAEEIVIRPGRIRPGSYQFDVGTAGSAILVLQTVLPPLLEAGAPSDVVVGGGTHNRRAPTYDFLAASLLPVLEQSGHELRADLERYGFHPAGGGRVRVRVRPAAEPTPLRLGSRGARRKGRVRAVVSDLPRHIAEREASVVHAMLGLDPDAMEVVEVRGDEAEGPGNAVSIHLAFERVTGVFTGFGRRGLPAEKVARRASRRALAWLESGAPVGPHLADQLLVPMATGEGGTFRTVEPTLHTRTQAELVRRLTGRPVRLERADDGLWDVAVVGGST